MGFKGRDIEVIPSAGNYLVAACDSCSAVGSKEFDIVKVPADVAGRFTTRVALLEVITVGAVPQLITAAIGNEPEPTGAQILQGVYDELAAFSLKNIPVAISTEKNFPTRQTSLGVTVVGCCQNSLRVATSLPGDLLYCMGLPKVGNEIEGPGDPEIVNNSQLQKLLQTAAIHDIIPVGSKGILGEAGLLSANILRDFILESEASIDIEKSAGPSTCLIFTAAAPIDCSVFNSVPCTKLGRIV
ncbi:MAG TPA: alpha-ribazole kinase [Firmicutes bacterium]|nr:alpha-ribazole kinase [Bacillota bacterium]